MKKGLRQFMLILASGSPRRQDLLKQVELNFLTIISNVDESSVTETDPKEKAMTLARLKSHAIDNDEDIILSCDTLIHFNGEILEKPRDKDDARRMLKMLSGNTHTVISAALLRKADVEIPIVRETEVEFFDLDDKTIDHYLNTDEPYDKAAAYGIQGLGAMFVKHISGDYNAVVGLPLGDICRKLREL